MIDLLAEAKNHMELYQDALKWRDWTQHAEVDGKGLKERWGENYRLPFPRKDHNPEGLRRALLLVAGWCLFHKNPVLSERETLDFLSQWYTAVMMYASLGMPQKERNVFLDRINESDKAFHGEKAAAQNLNKHLDKINYYRLVCQATANGPLRAQKIVVPNRILDYWRENRLSVQERALAILFHYYDGCGIPFESNRTEVGLWISGHSAWDDKKGSATLNEETYGMVRNSYLSVSEEVLWQEGESGVSLRDWPPMRRQLTDEALAAKRAESDPGFWLKTTFQTPEELYARYEKKNGVDLSNQYKETGIKYSVLKRFLLGLLYDASDNKTLPWGTWEEALSALPTETSALNWEAAEAWAVVHQSRITELMNQSGPFFRQQGKQKYYGRVRQKNGNTFLIFRCREKAAVKQATTST